MQFIASFLINRFISVFWCFASKYICYAKKMEIQHINRVIFAYAGILPFALFLLFNRTFAYFQITNFSLNQSSVAVQIDLYRNRSEAPKIGFLLPGSY